ncbi:hypothetical protein CRG98_029883 [Punica granatum]|uniref:Uncharacterized protein n=1 Tax=Punica granatum TaxID=22663 RepID=A0A2I0J0H6_PUNGR|nr:hypothetical protein CRG98_029883 [Punica granatum]
MCSRWGPYALDQIARLGSIHLLGGYVTDTSENESPLLVYDPKVEDQTRKSEFGGSHYVRTYIPHAISVL